MNVLCPRCLQRIAGFKAVKAAVGNSRSLECSACGQSDIPYRYSEQYTKFPPIPVSVMGCTGHGKTRYLDALHRELHTIGSDWWRGYAPEDLDLVGFRRMQQRLRIYDQGEAAEATDEPDFPDPQIVRLHSVPRFGNCQIIVFDTAGEVFLDPEKIRTKGRYLGKSNAVVWLASLRESLEFNGPMQWEPEEKFLEIFTAYADAMSQEETKTPQSLVLTLTKGERLLAAPGVPDSVRAIFKGDELADDRRSDPWDRLETVSDELREWLRNSGYHNVITLLEKRFRRVRYCVVSAQGREIDPAATEQFRPKAALAPLYWLWRFERPGIWLTNDAGRREFHFSLLDAATAAGPGDEIELEEGRFVLDRDLIIKKPLVIRGSDRNKTFVAGIGRQFLVGVQVEGKVTLEGCTFDSGMMQNGDVLKVVQGTVALEGCRFRAAKSDGSTSWGGCGVRVAEIGQVEASECDFQKNTRAGLSISSPGESTVSKCRASENAVGLDVSESARVNGQGNFWKKNIDGLVVSGSAHYVCERDEASENQQSGVIIRNSAQFRGEGLKSLGNGTFGALVERQAAALFSGARLERNQHGIAAKDAAAVTLQDCTLTGNLADGAIFADSTQGLSERSTYTGNQQAGLRLGGGASMAGTGNSGSTNREADLIHERGTPATNQLQGFQNVADRRRRWFL